MKINFPTKYEIVSYIPLQHFAVIDFPTERMSELVTALQEQDWIRSLYVYADGKRINIDWSAAFMYPEGEPLASLHKLCQAILEPEPVLDDVWSEVLGDLNLP